METADSSDCNTNLDLGLGFRHELGGILGRKKLKHGRSDKLFPFLALGFPEPNPMSKGDDDDADGTDVSDRKRSDAAAVASSFAAVSSPMFSQASKLSDEEDEDYSTTPRKKLRLSKDQILALEDTFKVHSTLNPKQKQELATQLKLLPRQVEVWFQNRRARVKVKQTEMEREELRKSCETLKEENRRLKKEVMQLKSMKKQMALPFLMHIGSAPPLPALTALCPSCGCTNYNASPATSFSSSKIRKTRSPL